MRSHRGRLRRSASTLLRLAASMRPASLGPRIQGTRPHPLTEAERAEFMDALALVHGADISDRALTLSALDAVGGRIRQDLIDEGRQVLEGRTTVLGHEVRTDPQHPDWHVDFLTEHRFSRWLPSEVIREAGYPGGFDIKVPWEFSRFHFGTRLGQAYWLSGDEEFALRLRRLLTDWIWSNPPGTGVNWVSSMEVGIRAINWVTALRFVRDAPALDVGFWELVHESLLLHGRWIRGRLESPRHGAKNANHYMTNVVSLLVLGACCRGPEAAAWYEFGLSRVCEEVLSQVHEDGGHFEDSPGYHRLFLELLLIAVGTAGSRDDGDRITDAVRARIGSMLEYALEYTRPDGSCPNFGDADSGRVLVLAPEDYATNVTHHLDTVALGALMQGRADLFAAADCPGAGAAWALPGPLLDALRSPVGSPEGAARPSRLRPMTGTAILRSPRLHVLVKCGTNGQGGLGGHSHNDKLGLELSDGTGAVLVDSGTGVYTSDYRLHGRMRATLAHNTLRLGRTEQNAFDTASAFGFTTDGPLAVLHWEPSGRYREFVGEFAGYGGVDGEPVHRRLVLLDPVDEVLLVEDAVVSAGSPVGPCAVSWHFAPRARSMSVAGAALEADLGAPVPWRVAWQPCGGAGEVDPVLEDGEYSERYAELRSAPVLRLGFVVAGDHGGVRTIVHRDVPDDSLARILARAETFRGVLDARGVAGHSWRSRAASGQGGAAGRV